MSSRFIPKQFSKQNFWMFQSPNDPKPRVSAHNGNSPSKEPKQGFFEQEVDFKKCLLREIFCEYDSKFGQNINYGTQKQSKILHFNCQKSQKPSLPNPKSNKNFRSKLCGKTSVGLPSFPGDVVPLFSSTPLKTLNAAGMVNNFYYNLLDFTKEGKLLVAIRGSVFEFDNSTTTIKEIFADRDQKEISSVCAHPEIGIFGVGFSDGEVGVVNQQSGKMMQRLSTQMASRVSALGMEGHILGHGTKHGSVFLFDIRSRRQKIASFACHDQEVCSLKFSTLDQNVFASGGNDNRVNIYDLRKMSLLHKSDFHKAAVKGLSFSKSNRRELFSGGGLHDNLLCRWDTGLMTLQNQRNLGSQICSLQSSSTGWVLTAHGWPRNQVEIREAGTFALLARFTAHSRRVLNLSISPSEDLVVSSGADESIAVWSLEALKRPRLENKFEENIIAFAKIR